MFFAYICLNKDSGSLVSFSSHSLGPFPFFSFEGQLYTFSRVLSLLGRYFYHVYIVKMFEIVFSFNVKDTNIFPC